MSSNSFLDGFPFILTSILEVVDMISNATLEKNNSNIGSCSPGFLYRFDFAFFGLTILFIGIFSLMTKRVSCQQHLCNGRPGLAVPMNMLTSHEFIGEYTLAFLALSDDIYQAIFGFKTDFGKMAPIEKFFVKIVLVVCFSLTSYPLFTAIFSRHLIGYILAMLFCSLFMAYGLVINYYLIKCLDGSIIIPFAFVTAVTSGINLLLLCIFLWKMFLHFKKYRFQIEENNFIKNDDATSSYRYVRNLFRRNHQINHNEDQITIKSSSIRNLFKSIGKKLKLKEKIHIKIPGFRIPPRLMISLSVGSFFAFRICMDQIMELTPSAWIMIYNLREKISSTKLNAKFAFKIVSGNYSQYSTMEIRNAYRYLTFFYTNLLLGSLIAAVVIGIFNATIQIFLIFRNYRLHFHQITRKGFSSIIPIKKAPSPAGLISGFVQYSGYQAAYILWGIVIVISFMFIFLFLVIGVVLLPLIYLENSWIRRKFELYVPVLIASFVLGLIQTLFIKYIFVKEKGTLMEVNNRRMFMIYTHCVFFLNVMMGIFNAMKRSIIWTFSGVFCFCRIDFCALPNYLRNWDSGYMYYIGFLYTEQYHHNPILKCFVNLLQECGKTNRNCKICSINESLNNHVSLKHRGNYFKKWQLLFTLLRNKQLQLERKHRDLNKFLNDV